jgi:coenzyme PQQ synthesis protein D (PqqD)
MRYRRNDAFDATVVDNDLFLIEPASEDIFYLDALAHGLWRLLGEPQDLDTILGVFGEAFPEASEARLRQDLMVALDGLLTRGLVVALV